MKKRKQVGISKGKTGTVVLRGKPYLTENKKGKVDSYFLDKARSLGHRIATLTLQMNGEKNTPTPPANE